MKKFRVIESSVDSYLRHDFTISTVIRENVKLPFTDDVYRCFMFDGIKVKLVNNNDDFIIGRLT